MATTTTPPALWPIPVEHVSPRVAQMMAQLYLYQDIIERCTMGYVEIHFSPKEAKLKLHAGLGVISS